MGHVSNVPTTERHVGNVPHNPTTREAACRHTNFFNGQLSQRLDQRGSRVCLFEHLVGALRIDRAATSGDLAGEVAQFVTPRLFIQARWAERREFLQEQHKPQQVPKQNPFLLHGLSRSSRAVVRLSAWRAALGLARVSARSHSCEAAPGRQSC